MKKIKRSMRLRNVHYEIRGPVLDEATRMEEAGAEIIKLNIGNPAPFHFDTPDALLHQLSDHLREAQGYSDSRGTLEARRAIQKYHTEKGIEGLTLDNIFTGNGVSEMIITSMQAFIDRGDEILLPAPDYPLWSSAVCLTGGTPVHYICDERSNWYPDIEDMKSKITQNTKGIVIINPNNPTGALYPREVLEQIAQVARENNLVIFADEIYDRLVMDGKEHVSIAAIAPDLFTVTYNGLSKSHLATGFRSGWMCMCGDTECAKEYISGVRLIASMRLCSNVPAQVMIPEALEDAYATRALYQPGGRIYEQREFIYQALNNIDGISAVKPDAAFYIFPKIDAARFHITNDEKFASDLLRATNVLLVQGSGFNWKDPDHFRIVYLPEIEQLKQATERIAEFLRTYRQ
ncbi:MAG: pyridoxal phosphate-dependent aminotransferase [Oscillospiraceae bacterium]|jgi:alanine-synthesizing transaminase